MNARVQAARVGLSRGLTEVRHILTQPAELLGELITYVVMIVVLVFLRGQHVAGTSLSIASLALPGILAMMVIFSPVSGAAFLISFEREDGTLLRSMAAPHGLIGYLAGFAVRLPFLVLLSLAILLVPGVFLFDGVADAGLSGWITMIWVVALTLLAALPIGMVLGGLSTNPRAVSSWIFLGSGALVAISGIFYPISGMPGWLHPVAQIFPFYWSGLGMRSALLPDQAAAVELTGSWEPVLTAVVLSVWAVVGLTLAPLVLRRMARGVSGAAVEAGRRKATQRMG